MSKNLLEVLDLQVSFDLREAGMLEAVQGVSFRVKAGKTTALVGESGSGKSVISQSILRILPRNAHISGGKILFYPHNSKFHKKECNAGSTDAIALSELDAEGQQMRSIRGGKISIIFQEPMTSFSPMHTIGDQVVETVLLHQKADRKEALELSEHMLEKVGMRDPRRTLEMYPFELSGGLRQRAMIAMALVCKPLLLIADEPTTALDVTIQAQILELLQQLQEEFQMAVLLITHDLGVVANLADEVAVVYHGQLLERGPMRDLLKSPRHVYLKNLLSVVPTVSKPEYLDATPALQNINATKKIVDHSLLNVDKNGRSPLLKVENLSKTYRRRKSGFGNNGEDRLIKALSAVNLEVYQGECFGLVGESGCGKTTLLKTIMGALMPDEGEIVFNNELRSLTMPGLGGSELNYYRSRVQFVFQDPYCSLNPRMTVGEIIAEPLLIHKIGTPSSRKKKVKHLLECVGLDARHTSRYPHSFSGGQRQRISIARALSVEPELLILDEPVSALDVSVQAQVLDLLEELKASLGLTYIFVSHNMAVVNMLADRIAVMCAGRIVEVASCSQLFKQPVHPYTRALLAAIPDPDPDVRLQLSQLLADRYSDPYAWPEPFKVKHSSEPGYVFINEDHMVRAYE